MSNARELAQIRAGSVEAWVTFNGTGTVAISASGNVSSITDNGTGRYTVNFTTAMPDANYSMSGSTEPYAGGDRLTVVSEANNIYGGALRTTTQLKVITGGSGAATSSGFAFDVPRVSVTIFS